MQFFQANLEQLPLMLNIIVEKAKAHGFDNSSLMKIELASEEALINIIKYAYPSENGSIGIQVELIANEETKGLKVVISDQGIPHNPLKNMSEINREESLETRKLGGFGIFLILKLIDEIFYERKKNNNVLTLIKYLPS